MVADAATIISFTVLVIMKLPTIPLQSEWLTLLKNLLLRLFVAFFIPPVAPLRMNPCMAGLAQRHKVCLVMGTAFCQWQPVVYLLHRPQQSFLPALLTERVLCGVAVTDTLPRPPIPTAYSRVTVVLLVAAVLLLPMLLTEPSLCQLWTAGEGTRSLRFPWHLSHLPWA